MTKNNSSDLNNPEVRDIEIVRLASDGTGVGFIEGKVTFVPGMIPGEKGRVRVVESKKAYQRAEVIDYTETAPARQRPRCTVYRECGGCDLQHLKYEETLKWKKQWVEDALARIGGLRQIRVEPVIGMEDPWRYRNKATLHIDREGRLGYYRSKTHNLVQFEDCLLLSVKTNERIRRIKEVLKGCGECINYVTFRENHRGEGLILFACNSKGLKKLTHRIQDLKKEELFSPDNCSLVITKGDKEFQSNETQYLNEYIEDIVFRVSPRAFLQVNTEQMKKLYALIFSCVEIQGKEEIWDLYCGIGTITLYLAKKAWKLIGIEENPFAVKDAIENAKLNNILNASFIQGKVEEKLKTLSGHPDIIITDPPRAGMDPLAVQRLLQIKSQKIIYVSCNPATLARDLKALNCTDGTYPGTYRIQKVQPVDMFPWTNHVETVVLMSRK
ncbi:MAG: 23S rRNA (uracil(1939)-C(5))-methyltransferase RlmD [Desulfitobacteriia bacterium]|jgi:23S rRNA (uracil1939-C5)-methyltransferase